MSSPKLGDTPSGERQLIALIVLIGLVVYAVAARLRLLHGAPWGDEPAYLVLSQAMQLYHSLDVVQVHANGDYRSFYPADLDPHLVAGADGQLLTEHQFGGPLLWLIPFALWGRAGAVGFMVLVSILCLINIYYFLRERDINVSYAFVATMAMAIGTPIYVLASMSFVEPIGALGVIFAVRAVLAKRLRAIRLVVASIGVAFLPWVHMRFAPLAVSLGVLLIWRVWRDYGRSTIWPYVRCVVPLALSVALIEVYTLFSYGEINPMAPQGIYGVRMFDTPLHEGIAGTLFDRNFGLVVNFPLFLLVLPGVLLTLDRAHVRLNTVLIWVITPYAVLSCTSTAWWGSYSPAGRYPEVIVPLLSIYVAVTLQRVNKWFATSAAIILAIFGYVLALTSDIFPAERFTGLNLRNGPMERVGDLVGADFAEFVPSAFLPGHRNVFIAWWAATVVVGVVLWFAGHGSTPERRARLGHVVGIMLSDWRRVSLQHCRRSLLAWSRASTRALSDRAQLGLRNKWWTTAVLLAVVATLVVASQAQLFAYHGPNLKTADVVGTWRSSEGGELVFDSNGSFRATGLRRDVVPPSPPGSSAERQTEPRRSAAGQWSLASSSGDEPSSRVELTFATVDGAVGAFNARMLAAEQDESFILFFFVVAPDLIIRYVFLKSIAQS